MKKHHIEILEKCDKSFFRQLFKSGASTPIESFYLLTNELPLRHIILGRRLMFLWSILHKKENELVHKMFDDQKLNPAKNDICLQFQEDLDTCEISLSMNKISKMKKQKFRKIVITQIREVARDYLLSLKSTHSKLDNLKSDYKLENYLTSDNLTTQQKQLLFMLQTRMVDVKVNFSEKYGQVLTCHFCPEQESQSHLLSCKQITDGIDTSEVQYKDFSKLVISKKELLKFLIEFSSKET